MLVAWKNKINKYDYFIYYNNNILDIANVAKFLPRVFSFFLIVKNI